MLSDYNSFKNAAIVGWTRGAILCLGLIVTAIAVVAQSASASPYQSRWTEKVFPERTHDFGTVARGSVLRHSFPIINRTDQEVRILRWQAKCGCTKIDLGARVLPPGSQTTIDVVFDTREFQGKKVSGLTLQTDRPTAATLEYEMSCTILDLVTVRPGNVDFRSVNRGGSSTLALEVDYRGTDPDWRVVQMSTISDAVKARLVEVGRSKSGGTRYRLTAELDPESLPNGLFRDQITLITNDPKRQRIPISVGAEVVSNLTIAPTSMPVGVLEPGERVERLVQLRSRQPFRITGANQVKGTIGLAQEPNAQRKSLHRVRIAFEAPSTPGAHHGILEIETDIPNEPPARVVTFATVRAQE